MCFSCLQPTLANTFSGSSSALLVLEKQAQLTTHGHQGAEKKGM